MRKRASDGEKQNTDRWLMTYSDMMNNLLVLFMVLYAMSIMDMAKFEALAHELNNAFSENTPMTDAAAPANYDLIIPTEVTSTAADGELKDEFDEIYKTLQIKIKENGYENLLSLEKGDDYIKFRFGDNVLFYPDSPVIKGNDVEVLTFIGDILLEIDSLIQTIEIGGHTATTGESTTSFFSWELSSERAISVLKYLVVNCSVPESKMSISGFSRYHPIADNNTEDNRQLNRRVEIKIVRVAQKPPQ